jgi:uroporphyrinogen-III synthase
MRRVLILRPEPGATATVNRARELGLEAIAVPLFEVEPVAWTMPDIALFDALLLTSANAVRQAGEELQELRSLPVYAVGDGTAEAAREAGLDVAMTGETGLDRLLGSVDANLSLLHLCGEDRKNLPSAPQKISSVTVYRAREIERADLSAAQGCVALVHSPRAGRRLAELLDDHTGIAIAAISQAAADAAGTGWENVEAANAPNDGALLALAARLCNKSPTK